MVFMNNKIKITNLVCFVLNDLYHSSKKWFLIDLLMNVLVSVFALATTIMFQTVFDNTNLVIQGSETVNHVRVLVIVLCICIISNSVITIYFQNKQIIVFVENEPFNSLSTADKSPN